MREYEERMHKELRSYGSEVSLLAVYVYKGRRS